MTTATVRAMKIAIMQRAGSTAQDAAEALLYGWWPDCPFSGAEIAAYEAASYSERDRLLDAHVDRYLERRLVEERRDSSRPGRYARPSAAELAQAFSRHRYLTSEQRAAVDRMGSGCASADDISALEPVASCIGWRWDYAAALVSGSSESRGEGAAQ